jgi:predicted Zn-ribbon and HTH transcriptional regulator
MSLKKLLERKRKMAVKPRHRCHKCGFQFDNEVMSSLCASCEDKLLNDD